MLSEKKNNVIGLHRKEAFRNFLNWQDSEDQHRNAVFVADLLLDGEQVAMYCKLYPEQAGTSRGLINEVVGYLFANALGLPQPDKACICEIPISRLPSAPAWLHEIEAYPAFCSTRLDGKAAGIRVDHQHDLVALVDEVRTWPGLHGAIALDESIAHVDRHFNNLIRRGKSDYALIDNGRLVNEMSESWTSAMLENDRLYANRLSDRVWKNRPGNECASRTLGMAAHHRDALRKIEDELDYWLSLLLKEQPSDRDRFRDFLHARMQDAELLLRKRFGRLI